MKLRSQLVEGGVIDDSIADASRQRAIETFHMVDPLSRLHALRGRVYGNHDPERSWYPLAEYDWPGCWITPSGFTTCMKRAWRDCGGGLCTLVGGMCDACADEYEEAERWHEEREGGADYGAGAHHG